MKHLTKETSSRATLKCSSGRSWNVEVGRAEGNMYFQDGWQQFLKDNSLGDREFLLFRYDGNLCFNVAIFKKNGCERYEMPVTGKHQEVAVTEGKGKRGRPRKNPLGSLPPLRSRGDDPGMQLNISSMYRHGPLLLHAYTQITCQSWGIWSRE